MENGSWYDSVSNVFQGAVNYATEGLSMAQDVWSNLGVNRESSYDVSSVSAPEYSQESILGMFMLYQYLNQAAQRVSDFTEEIKESAHEAAKVVADKAITQAGSLTYQYSNVIAGITPYVSWSPMVLAGALAISPVYTMIGAAAALTTAGVVYVGIDDKFSGAHKAIMGMISESCKDAGLSEDHCDQEVDKLIGSLKSEDNDVVEITRNITDLFNKSAFPAEKVGDFVSIIKDISAVELQFSGDIIPSLNDVKKGVEIFGIIRELNPALLVGASEALLGDKCPAILKSEIGVKFMLYVALPVVSIISAPFMFPLILLKSAFSSPQNVVNNRLPPIHENREDRLSSENVSPSREDTQGPNLPTQSDESPSQDIDRTPGPRR